jgi:hypothetical protein
MTERYIWAHQRLIGDLLTAAAEQREPVASARAAATSLEMIMATYESHFAGRRVAFPLASREHPLEVISGGRVTKEAALSV